MKMRNELLFVSAVGIGSWMLIWNRAAVGGRLNSTESARYAWRSMRTILWWCCFPASTRFIGNAFMNGSWTRWVIIWRVLSAAHLFTSRLIDSWIFKDVYMFLNHIYETKLWDKTCPFFLILFLILKAINVNTLLFILTNLINTFKLICLILYKYLANKNPNGKISVSIK